MKTRIVSLAMAVSAGLFGAEGWVLSSAPQAADAATGSERAGGVLELRIPSKRACGWWTRTFAIDPAQGGARFTARAEIACDVASDRPYNDVMMYVTWHFPKDGVTRKGAFFQRDFIAYTDRVEDGRTVRTFDELYAAPAGCDSVSVEFIGKWHAMTARISDVAVASVPPPKPRKVRCVVGNPHQKSVFWRAPGFENTAKGWEDPDAVVASRLWQIEATLTNIFAHVEHPDIILFSETFVQTGGSPVPERTDELVPGGPSFALAAKYAKRHHTYIAMNVRERTPEGTHHNSTFIVDREGRHVGTYRKVTLTSGEYQGGIVPGDGFKVFELDFGRVGCLTCWDNWFSESMKFSRRNGAELLLFPLAGCAPDHVDITFPARAIDCGIPILVAMRQGWLPNGIIDRDGTWIAKTFEDNGFAWADLDLNERKRTCWLSVGAGQGDPYELYLDESRPELYEKQTYGPRR